MREDAEKNLKYNRLFVTFLNLVVFQLGEGPGPMPFPLATPMTLIVYSRFNQQPAHVVAFFIKTFYYNYLCLVAPNKHQIQWTRIQKSLQDYCCISINF